MPTVTGELDTQNFEDFEEDPPDKASEEEKKRDEKTAKELAKKGGKKGGSSPEVKERAAFSKRKIQSGLDTRIKILKSSGKR